LAAAYFRALRYKNQIRETAAMDMYFAPLACSLATRVALYESGTPANDIRVDRIAKTLEDGSDYFAVNPMGQVPMLRLDSGEQLTETAAVLQYVADLDPDSGLAPKSGLERYRMQQWLNFVATELHKVVFYPLFSTESND